MAYIRIQFESITGGANRLDSARTNVTNARNGIISASASLDPKVRSRASIAARINAITNNLADVNNRLNAIKRVSVDSVNRYRQTEERIKKNALRLKHTGALTKTAAIPITIAANKKKKKNLSNQLSGALVSKKFAKSGKILGIGVAGVLSGEAIGGSLEGKTGAEFDLKKKNIFAGAEGSAKGHLLFGSASGNIGLLSGTLAATVGEVGATGKIGATMMKDGKFSPSIEAKLEAEATALKGEANTSFGNDDYNVHSKAEGKVATANAKADAGAGVITYKDSTGKTVTSLGAQANVSAEAYAATGSVSGGVTILGVKVDVTATGKAGGVGVSGGGRVSVGGASGEIGAGLGIGAGLKIDVDWSGLWK